MAAGTVEAKEAKEDPLADNRPFSENYWKHSSEILNDKTTITLQEAGWPNRSLTYTHFSGGSVSSR